MSGFALMSFRIVSRLYLPHKWYVWQESHTKMRSSFLFLVYTRRVVFQWAKELYIISNNSSASGLCWDPVRAEKLSRPTAYRLQVPALQPWETHQRSKIDTVSLRMGGEDAFIVYSILTASITPAVLNGYKFCVTILYRISTGFC